MKVTKKLAAGVLISLLAFGSVLTVSAAECRHQQTHAEVYTRQVGGYSHQHDGKTCIVKIYDKISDRRCDQCGQIINSAVIDHWETHTR